MSNGIISGSRVGFFFFLERTNPCLDVFHVTGFAKKPPREKPLHTIKMHCHHLKILRPLKVMFKTPTKKGHEEMQCINSLKHTCSTWLENAGLQYLIQCRFFKEWFGLCMSMLDNLIAKSENVPNTLGLFLCPSHSPSHVSATPKKHKI